MRDKKISSFIAAFALSRGLSMKGKNISQNPFIFSLSREFMVRDIKKSENFRNMVHFLHLPEAYK